MNNEVNKIVGMMLMNIYIMHILRTCTTQNNENILYLKKCKTM